ncbi:transcriptional regulator, LacI family [Sanguibacter gelidistatuariae]|uniref:Transcriptional regulator, LacI family n=1 Tax=Sanguibacter gelidistatuariae TaxID=1814289 RepID=A0A1G6UJW9_9MICO|nr:LacI family DNA-binding transcriptional regulator [Sanguibacter gelidistatuariae]SDD41720.1 transcriptional regulator, LacI family [Sanguibacter gelidistatuariae]
MATGPMATVRDVAAMARVSISTVSRALSAPDMVNEVTRQRVIDAARELDYRPNPAARGLRVGKTNNLGLLIPDLENPFFASVTKGVQSRARAAGYAVFVADSDEDPAQEIELIGNLATQVDGIILASPRAPSQDILDATAGKTVVMLNREVGDIPSITIDNADGVLQAVSHLRALGHRTIAYASGPVHSWSGEERRKGMVAVAEQFPDLTVVQLGNFRPYFSGGYPAADIAVASSATAVIAYNDLMALGIIDRLRQRGISVPDDMSVVGFDDVPVASLVSPALTTIQIPLAGLGRRGVDLLVERLEGAVDVTTRSEVPVELIIRNSTSVPAASPAASTP